MPTDPTLPLATPSAAPTATSSQGFVTRADFIKKLGEFAVNKPHDSASFAKNADEIYNLLYAALNNGQMPADKGGAPNLQVAGATGALMVLQKLTENFGFDPLSKPGGRAFWSGEQGKAKAIKKQNSKKNKNKFIALEGSDIGSFFDGVNLGTQALILWGEISTEFAKGAVGDVVVYCTEGVACHKVFWNKEVVQMRERQQEGIVETISIFVSRPAKDIPNDNSYANASHPEVHGAAKNWVKLCDLVKHGECSGLRITFDGNLPQHCYAMNGRQWRVPAKISEASDEKLPRCYDPIKLKRFISFMLPDEPGKLVPERGYLYRYGVKVLPLISRQLSCLSSIERMIGGVNLMLFDYDNFYIIEIHYYDINPAEFMDPQRFDRSDLDVYLKDHFQTWAMHPKRMAVVRDAVIYDPLGSQKHSIQAIRMTPGEGFTDLNQLMKERCAVIAPNKLEELTKLLKYGGIGELDLLHRKSTFIGQAVAELRQALRKQGKVPVK
jgi:hypothetical protein